MERHPLKDSFTGASSEYRAASWFLSNHRQVYWPSLQQSDVDFVVEYDGQRLLRVQVKTATSVGPDSFRVRLAKSKDFRIEDVGFDLLVGVSQYGHIWMIPKDQILPSMTFNTLGPYFEGKC